MPRHSPGSVQQVGPLSSTRHTPRACAPRRTRGMLAPGCQRRRRPTRTQVWGSRGHSVRTLHTGGWGGGQIERDIHTGESLATDRQPLLNCSNRCSFAHPASYFLSTSITLLTFLRVCVMCAFLHSLTLFTFFWFCLHGAPVAARRIGHPMQIGGSQGPRALSRPVADGDRCV